MSQIGARVKSPDEIEMQLRSVEELLGEPIWLGDSIPGRDEIPDIKGEYAAKYQIYLRSLRTIQSERDQIDQLLLTPEDQLRLQIINNIERFARGDFEFSEGSIALYPYQKELFAEIAKHVQSGARGGWGKIPTGYGKSIVGAAISSAAGVPAVILVPRLTLVSDAVEALAAIAPDRSVSVFHGEEKDLSGDVIVVLYQSLGAFNREAKKAGLEFPIAIFDEAHLALTQLKQSLINDIPGLIYTFAETATPYYAEGKNVGLFFGDGIYEMTLAEGIELGILSPIRDAYLYAEIDLSSVQVSSQGNYNKAQLARAMDRAPLVEIFCQAVTSEALRGKAGVGFVPSIEQSEAIAKALRERGVRAEAVHGKLPPGVAEERQEMFESGEIDFMISPQMLSIGWDSRRVEYAIDVDPTRSRVDKEQRIGRLARRSAHAPIKLYLEILPHDSRRPVVTASMILGNSPLLESPSVTSTQRERSDLVARKLGEEISIDGIKVVVEIDQLRAIDRELDKAIVPIDDEIVKKLLTNLPPYVLRNLNRGKTATFLQFRFNGPEYFDTGRSLTRQYFNEVLLQPLDRVSDDDVYQMVQAVMPQVGRFKFLDQSGDLSVDQFRGILADAGINTRVALEVLGRSGVSNLRLNIEGEKVTGTFLLSRVARTILSSNRYHLTEVEFSRLCEELYPSEISPQEMLEQRRGFLREIFKTQNVLLAAPEAVAPSRFYEIALALSENSAIKSGRLVLRHLNQVRTEPISHLRAGHLFEFLADIFPEHAERFLELRQAYESPTSEVSLANVESILKSCGFSSAATFETYGPAVLFGAVGRLGKFSYSGTSALRIYRELRGLPRREVTSADALRRMTDEVLGTYDLASDLDVLDQTRKFLLDAGYDADILTSETTGKIMRTPISHQGVSTTLERLFRAVTLLRTNRQPNSVRALDVREFIIELFPEAAEGLNQRSNQISSHHRGTSRGALSALTADEREFACAFGMSTFSYARFDIDERKRNGESLIYGAERGLAVEAAERAKVEESAKDLKGGEATLFDSGVSESKQAVVSTSEFSQPDDLHGLMGHDTSQPNLPTSRSKTSFESKLAFLFDTNEDGISAQIEQAALLPYVRSILERDGFARSELISGRYEDIVSRPVSVGRVSIPFGRILRHLAEVNGQNIKRFAALGLACEQLFPDVALQRSSYWIDTARTVLTSSGITTAEQLLSLESHKFFTRYFEQREFCGTGAALVNQVIDDASPRSQDSFKRFAELMFPGQLVDGALAYLCSKNGAFILRRLLLDFATRSIEDLNRQRIPHEIVMHGLPAGEWSATELRFSLGKKGILPPAREFSESDLLQLGSVLTEVLSDQGLLGEIRRHRELCELISGGGANKILRSFSRKSRGNMTMHEFARTQFLRGNEEYSGDELLASLRIRTAPQFNSVMAPFISKEPTRVEQPNEELEASDEILFINTARVKVGILEQTIIELAPQYVGEAAAEFDRCIFTISASTRSGEELRAAFVANSLLSPDQKICTETLLDIVAQLELPQSDRMVAARHIGTAQKLERLGAMDFLKVVNGAQRTLELGSGLHTAQSLKGKVIEVPGGDKISAEVFARYLAKRFDVSIEERTWQAKLLPKLMRAVKK